MKGIFKIALIAVFAAALVLAGCGGGGGGGGNAIKNIAGTWETGSGSTTMILNADKTGSMDGVDIFWAVYSDKDGTYFFADREPLPEKFEVAMLQRPHHIYDAKEGTIGSFKKVK